MWKSYRRNTLILGSGASGLLPVRLRLTISRGFGRRP
jgi:hypothetical protein